MRINQKTANIIANLTDSLGHHVRPKIIIKRASRDLPAGYTSSSVALLVLALLLFILTIFFVGGIIWYFWKSKPRPERELILKADLRQMNQLQKDLSEILESPNRSEFLLQWPGNIITTSEIRSISRYSSRGVAITHSKDQASDASTASKTQASYVDPMISPALKEDQEMPILRLIHEGKKSFSLKIRSSRPEDSD
jgi:hypothetical protein